MSSSELACAYATVILQDDGLTVSADNIQKLIAAAGVSVEAFYPGLFAKYPVELSSLVGMTIGSGGGAAAGGAAAAAGPADAPAAAVEAPPAAVEEEEEEAADFDLFD
ncbi:60S acidic ribosomal protein P1 [Porphyridium purpureum]|uniref:60S acidic ribosomal protein P1 n=1 Tax=Porphyridium purpureum TaxID=35688 RepID=A0A5J4YX36_PORPP|nr:60S acidic ribosomal protein P1 [Porphyridium purpureum]|eukprot:POR8600..scf227_4